MARSHFPLSAEEIHVRALHLVAPDSIVSAFESVLNPDELDHANRFSFAHLRRTFVLSRGGLRLLLGEYLNADPSGLQFVFGPHGKPALVTELDLRFNVSHSGDLALVAVATGRDVGVDVEKVREIEAADDIARRYFAPGENSDLALLPMADRLQAFFRVWTRKEAFIKAIGEGLYLPLESFRVPVDRASSPKAVDVGGCAGACSGWSVLHLEPMAGHIGALAFHGPCRNFHIGVPEDPQELLASSPPTQDRTILRPQ